MRWKLAQQLGTRYACNLAGRLKSIPGLITTISYDARGRITAANYANGTSATNSYDGVKAWLMRVQHASGPTSLLDQTYGRDAIGRITAVTVADNPAESWTCEYDTLDRLTRAQNLGNASLSNTVSYDAAHTIKFITQVGTYTDPAQGAGAVRPHAPSLAGPYALSHDENGNTRRGRRRPGSTPSSSPTMAAGNSTAPWRRSSSCRKSSPPRPGRPSRSTAAFGGAPMS